MNAEKTCEQKITSALDYLSKSGLRLTAARRSLLDLLGDSDRPLSVEEISERSDGRFDLVTVYRNMDVFAELGVVQSIQLENGKALYELSDVGGHHHHHIVCRSCHKVERIDFCMGGELERYASQRGYSSLKHTIEVFGLCPVCDNRDGLVATA